MKNKPFTLSIRCYYSNGESNTHYQELKLSDIPKWVEAYKFTHPNCEAITVKVWFEKTDKG